MIISLFPIGTVFRGGYMLIYSKGEMSEFGIYRRTTYGRTYEIK